MRKARPKPKDRYHHGDLRKALVDASLAIIAKEGAEALTLRSAARQAGVSHAAPYAHFEDKEDLIAAVKEEGFRELKEGLEQQLTSMDAAPTPRLKAVATLYLRFAAEQPAKYQIMFRRPLAKVPGSGFTYLETGRTLFRMMTTEVAALRTSVKASEKFSSDLVAMCAWSALHGLCSLWNDGPITQIVPPGTEYPALAEQFVEYLLQSIGAS